MGLETILHGFLFGLGFWIADALVSGLLGLLKKGRQ